MVDEQQDEIQVAAEPPVVTAPAKPVVGKTDTAYVLLSLDKSGMWEMRDVKMLARSAEAAVTAWAEQAKPSERITLVAVAEARWKALTVTPKTVTTLTVEEAK